MSSDAERLMQFFHDNIWASIRYVHFNGYGDEAQELINLGLIQQSCDIYILTPKTVSDLPKKEATK